MLFAGTSGFSFKEWVGPFYPPKTPAKKYLAYYASLMNSVEINHTFRRFPRPEHMEKWAAETPESFKFSIKMHQSVTHMARLRNVSAAVAEFIAALDPLGPRLGVVLFQLPPNFRANVDLLRDFLKALPSGRKCALEFRHESWREPAVRDLLREAGVALCGADVEIGETVPETTARHAYLRLRKEPPYTEAELEGARRQVAGVLAEADDLYLYVKHDAAGLAPAAVERLKAP